MAALQNGAKLFVNYCLNCHPAAFMRYNRLRDIGLTEQQIKDNLMFTGAKVGDTMKVALDAKDAKDWFGAAPPDLTVIARSRSAPGQGSGADYLYTYLRTYYRDDTKATGWNNLAFPSVGMPHVLWELQGEQRAVFADEKDPHDPAKTVHVFKGFEQITPGTLSAEDYNLAVADLVAFLQWMSEPNAEQPRAPGRVGAAVPGGLHRHRLAPERGLSGRTSSSVRCSPGRAAGRVSAAGPAVPAAFVVFPGPPAAPPEPRADAMMVLYSGTTCPYSHRCRFVLFEKGMDFEIRDVDLFAKPEDIALMNPYNEVPILVERDLILYESHIINEYIDERFPHPQLMPGDPVARARVRLFLFNFEKELFSHVNLLEGRGVKATEKQLEKARDQIRDRLTQLAPIFLKNKYMLGDDFSMLDVAIAPLLWRLDYYGIDLSKNAVPLLKYAERIFSRPAYIEALTPSEKVMRK